MNGKDITGIRGLHVRPIEINDSDKYNNYIESVYNLSITLYEYLTKQFENQLGETLEDFLDNKVFSNAQCITVEPDEKEVEGFDEFLKGYKAALESQVKAAEFK